MMTDRVIFVCSIFIAAVYLYGTEQIPSLQIGDPLGPKAFPRLLGVFLLIGASLLFIEMWKDRKAPQSGEAESAAWQHVRVIAAVTAWTGAYYAVFDMLGYIVATATYLFALMAWFNRGKWIANVLTAVLFSILSYVMFVKLDVNLPRGVEGISGVSNAVIAVTNFIVNLFKSVFGSLK